MVVRSGVAVGQATGSSYAEDIRELERATPVRCPSARRGLRYYRTRHGYWVTKRGAAKPVTRNGRSPRNCADARYLADVWRRRAHTARLAYQRWWRHEYAWWVWLPSNWAALGACETGYGRPPGNWNHSNARFTSAFGISWAEYDNDARHMGVPPWHVRHTPRDQYEAALGHYDRFGDGWSCPGP